MQVEFVCPCCSKTYLVGVEIPVKIEFKSVTTAGEATKEDPVVLESLLLSDIEKGWRDGKPFKCTGLFGLFERRGELSEALRSMSKNRLYRTAMNLLEKGLVKKFMSPDRSLCDWLLPAQQVKLCGIPDPTSLRSTRRHRVLSRRNPKYDPNRTFEA